MKQRAMNLENAKRNTEVDKAKPSANYFANFKQNLAKTFRTNNKIQNGDHELAVDVDKVDHKTESNGITTAAKEQTISTITLSNSDYNQANVAKA